MIDDVTAALRDAMPSVMRWGGAIAQELRAHDITLSGKSSGNSNTDALTLADLTVQQLLVDALRDADPILKSCRIAAEETTGDLDRFAADAELTLCLDPIDGTKQFRDRSGEGWSLMLHVQSPTEVLYSLVYAPTSAPDGVWIECSSDGVRVGEDNHSRPAGNVLSDLDVMTQPPTSEADKYYLIGFQASLPHKARAVTEAGLTGVPADDCPKSIYELMARGEYAGSLIHSPNIYDFPVASHIARVYGGDSVWVDSGDPVHFRDTWMDDRADMLRLPGIVATSTHPSHLDTLREVARDWNPVRYAE